MNSVPPLLDADKETDVQAFSSIPYVVPMFFGEIQVIRGLFVYLTMIANQIVLFPIDLIRKIQHIKDPRYKYSLCIFICWLITLLIPIVFNIPLEISLKIILGQSYYKIWKFFTLFFIVQRFLTKVHSHTHKVLRGAIWEGKSIFGAIILHTISNILILFAYDIYFGSYLAGIYGKAGLFISACLHIQNLIAKKFLPKVLENSPNYSMPIDRIVMLCSILVHIRTAPFEQVIPLIYFEYGFVFIKNFLVSISDESVNLYNVLKLGADNAYYKFYHGEQSAADSVLLNFPVEVFSIIFLLLIVKGPMTNSIYIGGGVLAFSILGSIICNLIGKNITLPAPEEEKAEDAPKENNPQPAKEKTE